MELVIPLRYLLMVESQYRYTLAGEGYISQNSFYEFFGLGEATEVDYVKVTWTGTNTEDIL